MYLLTYIFRLIRNELLHFYIFLNIFLNTPGDTAYEYEIGANIIAFNFTCKLLAIMEVNIYKSLPISEEQRHLFSMILGLPYTGNLEWKLPHH